MKLGRYGFVLAHVHTGARRGLNRLRLVFKRFCLCRLRRGLNFFLYILLMLLLYRSFALDRRGGALLRRALFLLRRMFLAARIRLGLQRFPACPALAEGALYAVRPLGRAAALGLVIAVVLVGIVRLVHVVAV